VGQGVGHPVISSNLIFSDQRDASLIRFADPGMRCAGGERRGRACASNPDCPGGFCAPTQHAGGIITGNLFVRGAPGQTAIDLHMGSSPSGNTLISGFAITANQFAGVEVGIRLPANAALVSGTTIVGNSFGAGVRTPVEGFRWTSGTLLDNAPLGAADDAITLVWLTNGDPDAAVPGDAVEVDDARDNGFRRARSSQVMGVVLDAPAPGGVGKIAVRGTTTCNLDGTAVMRGSRLSVSRVPGKLHAAAGDERPFATALSEGMTSVRCLLQG
jgi:hypothetical protein